uniref:Uncharacterized protein n=1 Tax=Anguilla anguilla TaxID=7936 RepID=A0A0E9WVD3_ANGAN
MPSFQTPSPLLPWTSPGFLTKHKFSHSSLGCPGKVQHMPADCRQFAKILKDKV